MSFDNTIAALITAMNANTEALRAHAAQLGQPVQHLQVAAPLASPATSAPQVAAQATFAAGATTSPGNAMPGAPSFMPTATLAPAPAAAPFSTQQQLFDYTAAAYNAMGAEKGGKIGTVILAGMGVTNMNDLKPEQYGAFYQQVEALKAGA